FEIDRADPFAAGFDEIFGTVDDLDEALVVHSGDVAGLEPTVGGPAMGLIRRVVIASGNPGTTDFKLAGSFPISRSFDFFSVVRTHYPQFDKRGGPALLAARFVAVVFTPLGHVPLEFADGSEWSGLRHAPKMHNAEIVLIERAHETRRRRGTADYQADRGGEFPATGIFFKRVKDAEPDGGDAAGDGHLLILNKVKNAFGVHVWPRKNHAGASHYATEGQAPGIGVEHRSDGEHSVVMADREAVDHAFGERVKNDGAMGVDDALGETGGAGGKAHGGAVVLIKLGIVEPIGSFGYELFVVEEPLGDVAAPLGAAAIGRDDHVLERDLVAKCLEDRQEHIVNDEEAILSVVCNGGNFVRVKTEIERVQDTAGARDSKESFKVTNVVPHHGSDAIPTLETQ